MNKLNGGKLIDVKHPKTNSTNNSITLFTIKSALINKLMIEKSVLDNPTVCVAISASI